MIPDGAVGTKDNIGAKGQRDGVGKTNTTRRAVKHTAGAIWIRSTNTIRTRGACMLHLRGRTYDSTRPHVTSCSNFGSQRPALTADLPTVLLFRRGRLCHGADPRLAPLMGQQGSD